MLEVRQLFFASLALCDFVCMFVWSTAKQTLHHILEAKNFIIVIKES